MALESLGEAWVDVHARVDSFDEDLRKGVEKQLPAVEKEADKVGKDVGETIGKSMEKEVGKQGPAIGHTIAQSVEKSVEKEAVKFAPNWRYDNRGSNGRFVKKMVGDIEQEVEKAFSGGGGTGIFNKIGQGFADAVGSISNVSGSSPLIVVLIPAMGALVGLILGAVQAAGSLVAVLSTLPALIGAVGLQAGVLFAAFHGVGTAITDAFAAKNAKELKTAIEDLTPSAQKFVKSLLPLKGLFADLSKIAQENFFKEISKDATDIRIALTPILKGGFGELATALGGLFHELAIFFESATFKEFLKTVIPATVAFLNRFGPDFMTFLTGLMAFATTTIPFLSKIGDLLGGELSWLGTILSNAARDPATQKWLDEMFTTLVLVFDLFGALLKFVFVFLDQLNKAGGNKILEEIIKDVEMITFLLESPLGQKAFEGLVHIVILALQATTGFIGIIIILIALVETTAEFIKHALIPAIGDFIGMIGSAIAWLWNWFGGIFSAIWDFFANLETNIENYFINFWKSINSGRAMLIDAIKKIPGQIMGALGDLGGLLWNAGKSLLSGFINGIKSMFTALRGAAADAIHMVTQFFPGSPAETGPLSGRGYSKFRGQRMIQDFTEGMKLEMPTLNSTSSEAVSNIVFGPNSINVGFEGVVPTQQQARSTGSGVASGIMGGLAARDARLAVRTI